MRVVPDGWVWCLSKCSVCPKNACCFSALGQNPDCQHLTIVESESAFRRFFGFLSHFAFLSDQQSLLTAMHARIYMTGQLAFALPLNTMDVEGTVCDITWYSIYAAERMLLSCTHIIWPCITTHCVLSPWTRIEELLSIIYYSLTGELVQCLCQLPRATTQQNVQCTYLNRIALSYLYYTVGHRVLSTTSPTDNFYYTM